MLVLSPSEPDKHQKISSHPVPRQSARSFDKHGLQERSRVLLVDDEPAVLDVTRLFLEKTGGIEPVCCNSAPDALALLDVEPFDAIVSDYDMPDMNGIEFLNSLRNSGNNLPFILYTGRGREDVVIEALNSGASYYIRKGGLPKPQFTELAHIISQAIEKSRYEEEIRESQRLVHAIFHHLPDPTYAIDTSGRVIAWNRGMEELTGVFAGAVIGRSDYASVIPFYQSWGMVVADSLLRSGMVMPDSWAILDEREGMVIAEVACGVYESAITFWVKSTHLYDSGGRVIGAIESVRDITQDKKNQTELIRISQYHRALIEAHIDPLVTLSPDLVICDVNEATEDLMGYSRDELIGTGIETWVTEPDAVISTCRTLFTGDVLRICGFPLTLNGKSGEREAMLYATICSGPDERSLRIFAELHDPAVL